MTDDGEEERAFVFQRLGIGYFLLGFAPAFVLLNPQSIGPLALAMVGGLVTGAIAFVGFQLVGRRLLGAVAGVDVDASEPQRLPYYSTYLVVALGALVFLPVVLWVMASVAPSGEIGGGGRRSPLVGALLVSAAVMSVVAEPLWLRTLRALSVDVVE